MLLGLERVELSSVKAIKVTRPTLAADGAKAAFQDQSDRSRCSTAINWPTCWRMIEEPAGGCNERAWTGSRATEREVESEGEGGR